MFEKAGVMMAVRPPWEDERYEASKPGASMQKIEMVCERF